MERVISFPYSIILGNYSEDNRMANVCTMCYTDAQFAFILIPFSNDDDGDGDEQKKRFHFHLQMEQCALFVVPSSSPAVQNHWLDH